MVHVFIPVHWLTDFGGLHENVYESATAYLSQGWQCTVMAPTAKFNSKLVAAGVRVLENDMVDKKRAVETALKLGCLDLVHSHPFAAREVGQIVSDCQKVPMIITMHGQYLDNISSDVKTIICVAPEISKFLKKELSFDDAKFSIVPNAVDSKIFASAPRKKKTSRLRVVICSRIDPDKVVLFRFLIQMVKFCSSRDINVDFSVVGETFYGDTQEFRSAFVGNGGSIDVNWQGWVDDKGRLAKFFHDADLVIASGRGAMEAFACGRPTIAVASRGYVGLLKASNIIIALDTNFGGVETDQTVYSASRVERDLEEAFSENFVVDSSAQTQMLDVVELNLVRQVAVTVASQAMGL